MLKKFLQLKTGPDTAEDGRPEFQSRKTVADYVRENMASKNRKSFYQRLIAIAHLKNGGGEKAFKFIKPKFSEIMNKCNINVACEQMYGMYLYHGEYCVFVIEGSEDVLGNFMVALCEIEDVLFDKLKVISFANNIGNTFFNTFIWRTYEPPISTEDFQGETDEKFLSIHNDLLGKLELLFRAVGTEFQKKVILADTESVLPAHYIKILPTMEEIKFMLNASYLYDMKDYADCYKKLPPIVDYDSAVWPIQFDYTPLDVFKLGKFDVNLTFKNIDP